MGVFSHLLTVFGKFFKNKKFVRERRKKLKAGKTPKKRDTKISRQSSARPRKRRKAVKPCQRRVKKKISRKRETVKSKNKSTKKVIRPSSGREGPGGVFIGEVTHYFSKIGVCVVKITRGNIRVGDKIRMKGKTSDFVQKVKSLQIESRDVRVAGKGQVVGLKADQIVRGGDKVYKI